MLIPAMWARDYGDVGQSWSEATLVVSYISYVAHMSQEKGKEITVSIISFLAL